MSMNNFEAEMSRFESEISNVNSNNGPPRMSMMPPVPLHPGLFPPMMPRMPSLPPPPPNVMAQLLNNNNGPSSGPGGPAPRLPPRPAFVPHQLRHRVPQQSVPFSSSASRPPQMSMNNPQRIPSPPPAPNPTVAPPMSAQQQPVLSAQPMLYKNQSNQDKTMAASDIQMIAPAVGRPVTTPMTVESKPSTSTSFMPKPDKSTAPKPEAHPHPVSKAYALATQSTESNDRESEASSSSKKKNKTKTPKKNRFVRVAGGMTWEDETLADWDSDDFRLFCGDLGNEVNDDLLTRAFNKYPSFQKARVVRDKRTGKTRGYGFVSFKDSQDYIRAMREMNGKYVGNRPIKLRKSNWRDRNIEIVRKKVKDKVKMGLR